MSVPFCTGSSVPHAGWYRDFGASTTAPSAQSGKMSYPASSTGAPTCCKHSARCEMNWQKHNNSESVPKTTDTQYIYIYIYRERLFILSGTMYWLITKLHMSIILLEGCPTFYFIRICCYFYKRESNFHVHCWNFWNSSYNLCNMMLKLSILMPS